MMTRATASRIRQTLLVFGICAALLAAGLYLFSKPAEANEYDVNECASPNAAWLFCDDFEQNRLNSYFDTGDPAKLYKELNAGLDGSSALTAKFQGDYPGAGSLQLAFGKTSNPSAYKPVGNVNQAYREFYWRTYVKNGADWAAGYDGRFAAFYVSGAGGQTIAKAELRYSGGALYAFLSPAQLDGSGMPIGLLTNSIYVPSSAGAPLGISNIDSWQQIEVRGKLNDSGQANGVFQVWVNGSLRLEQTNVNWVGAYADYGFNVVELNNYVSVAGVPLQHRQHDNIVLSTEPIGSASSGPATPPPNLIFSDTFDTYTNSPLLHGWNEVSSKVTIDPGAGPDGSNAAKVSYETPLTVVPFSYAVGDKDLNQVFVSFDFKFDDPSGGSKFLKLFGKPNNPQGRANTTFGLLYSEPTLNHIGYGTGVDLDNDYQVTIDFDGEHDDSQVVIEHATSGVYPTLNQWHSFKAFMRYNSNGHRDGEYMVWIDGVLRIHATNVKNRNDLNSREFASVDLANYTHNLLHPWNLWYDNFQVMRDLPDELKAEMNNNNAQLGTLTVGTGTLSPAFTPAQSSYTLDLAPNVSSLNVVTTTQNAHSTVKINGQTVGFGEALAVPVGINDRTIQIAVTAPDGTSTKTYTITTNRPGIIDECGNPRDGWLFCEDFRTNQLTQYYDYFTRWGRFIRESKGIDGSTGIVSYYGFYSGDTAIAGPYGTWMKLAVGKTPNNAVYKPVGDDTKAERELYWRFYVRNNTIASGNSNINNGPLARVYGYGPGNIPFMQIDVSYPDSSGVLVSQLRTGVFDSGGAPTGTTLADTLTGTTPIMAAANAGPWRLVEIRAKLNDPGQSNGVYQLWIDGQLESGKSGVNWVGSYTDYGINAVELYNTNNQPGVPGGDDEYHVFDNMVVSRAPIGQPGSVSLVNANLSNIARSKGKLSPAFHANQTTYTLTVEHGVTEVDVTPVTADDSATLKVNGVARAAGTAVTLDRSSPLTIEVTARDGSTTKTYTVSLAEAAPFLVNECSSLHGDWLFCDDYEADRMGQYFEHTSPDQFYRATDVGLGGSSGMKAEFRQADGTDHDTGALKVAFGRTPTSYMTPVAADGEDLREVYFRFYVKNQDGWLGGGADKLARLSSMQTANWSQSMIAHVWSGNGAGVNQLVAEPARGTDASGNLLSTKWNDWANLYWFGGQASTTPIYDANHVGEWYAIETRVKLNDPGQSNGIFQVWIDDQLEMSRTDLNWIGSYEIGPGAGYGLNWLALENYWNAGSPQDQERYFDNFVISRSKIGLATDNGEPAEALTIDDASKLAGASFDLTVGVPDPQTSFNVADVIVNYDPQKLTFATEANGNSVQLADGAIESLVPGFSVASAVKESQGRIRVILTKTGTAASGGQPILRLHGQVKADAVSGSTSVSLSSFSVSWNGVSSNIDVSGASVTIDIAIADKTALNAAIAAAQQAYSAAVVGTAPGQYPASAKENLNAAINAAIAVRNDAGATQQTVNGAVATLNAAAATFANAVIAAEQANVTTLNAAISAAQSKHSKAAEGTKLGQYAPGSKATLQAAINAAIAVRDSSASTQAQVNQAVATLNQAIAAFSAKITTLVPGASRITIADLSIVAKYFGVTNGSANWGEIQAADLFGQGEITIEVLAAVARMILDDWLLE